jgi:hypothetical protein
MGPVSEATSLAVVKRKYREPGWTADQASMPGCAKIG